MRFLTFTTTFLLLCGSVHSTPYKVYIFLCETCPLSQYYTLALKDLHQKYQAENVDFIGVFPNSLSTPETIRKFQKKYSLPFSCIPDSNHTYVNSLGATVTPEVVVVDTSRIPFYRGRIDNAFARVGKRRRVVTQHELADVLQSLSTGRPLKVQHTTAIGCFITTHKTKGE